MFTGLGNFASAVRTPDLRHLVFVPEVDSAIP
jgi:hypothetical protein